MVSVVSKNGQVEKPGKRKGSKPRTAAPGSRRHSSAALRLTAAHIAFIDEYMKDRNGKRSAIAVGKAESSAAVYAVNALKHPAVKAEIERRMAAASELSAVTVAKVLNGLDSIAFFDMGDLFDEDNRLIPIKKLPEHIRKSLSHFELVTNIGGRVVSIKPVASSRMKALELLAKHKGMLEPAKKGDDGPTGVHININFGGDPKDVGGRKPLTIEHGGMSLNFGDGDGAGE